MHRIKSDKGDVPGWVLITLMTAGLVVLSENRVISVLLFCRNPSRWMPHFSFMSPELRRRQTKTSDHNPSKSESNRNPIAVATTSLSTAFRFLILVVVFV
jgi:hypothetical protein